MSKSDKIDELEQRLTELEQQRRPGERIKAACTRREFVYGGLLGAAGMAAMTGTASAQSGGSFPEDFHGMALLIGNDADKPDPGGEFFDNKTEYNYVYFAEDTGEIHTLRTDDASWQAFGGGIATDSDLQWTDSDGDDVAELQASDADLNGGALLDATGVTTLQGKQHEVRNVESGEKLFFTYHNEANRISRIKTAVNDTLLNGFIQLDKSGSDLRWETRDGNGNITCALHTVRGDWDVFPTIQVVLDLANQIDFGNSASTIRSQGGVIQFADNQGEIPLATIKNISSASSSGESHSFFIQLNEKDDGPIPMKAYTESDGVGGTQNTVLRIPDGDFDISSGRIKGLEILTSAPAAGDLDAGDVVIGDATGPNSRDEIFWSVDGSTIARVEADSTIT